jgi:hypothetical protein
MGKMCVGSSILKIGIATFIPSCKPMIPQKLIQTFAMLPEIAGWVRGGTSCSHTKAAEHSSCPIMFFAGVAGSR